MAKKKENKEKEEKEFQLELLKVQIVHQDILSVLTLFIAILFSAMVSLATTYMNFFFMSKDLNWAYAVITVLVMFSIAMFLTVRYYSSRGIRKLKRNLQEELQRIREKFIDKKPVEKEETKKNCLNG